MEKVSASTAVECGLAVLEPSGIVHRRNNKGYAYVHRAHIHTHTRAHLRGALVWMCCVRRGYLPSHLANRQCSATFSCERHQGKKTTTHIYICGGGAAHTHPHREHGARVCGFCPCMYIQHTPGDRSHVQTPRTPGPVHPVGSYRFLLMRACGLLIVVAHGGIRPLRSARQSSLCSDRVWRTLYMVSRERETYRERERHILFARSGAHWFH